MEKIYILTPSSRGNQNCSKSNSSVEEYEYEDKNKLNFKNNIYLGTISRVEPSLQAAFVDFGRTRHGFLAFNDIQIDYYQIPAEDKEKIKTVEEKIREELKNNNLADNNAVQESNSLETKENNENVEEKTRTEVEKNKSEYREKLKTHTVLKNIEFKKSLSLDK